MGPMDDSGGDIVDLTAFKAKRIVAAKGPVLKSSDDGTKVVLDLGDDFDFVIEWSPESAIRFGKQVAEMGRKVRARLDWKPPPPPVICPFCKYPFAPMSMTATGRFPKHRRYSFSHGYWGSSFTDPWCPSGLRSAASAKELYLKSEAK